MAVSERLRIKRQMYTAK